MHLCSFTRTRVGLQPRLETDEHLIEIPIHRFCLLVVTRSVFGFPEKMCPAPLKITAERWIRRPPIADDRSREVLAEDFCGNITPTTLSYGV